jgi:hypothetical protein
MSERFYERVKENITSKKNLTGKPLEERVNYKIIDILGFGRLNRFFLKHGIGSDGRTVTKKEVANRILKEGLADNLEEAEKEAYLLLGRRTMSINDSSGADIKRNYNENEEIEYRLWCGFKP